MRKLRDRQAFTLVELLVAVAIIAVLAALLFPVFQAAIHRSKVSACATNLSQLGHAMAMYAEDNGDSIPPYFLEKDSYRPPGVPLYDDPMLFKSALTKYGAADAQFYCPLDKDARKTVSHGPKEVDHTILSYRYSAAVFRYSEQGIGILKLNLSSVERPSGSVYLVDDFDPLHPVYVVTPHGTWQNCLYFDGHVKERNTRIPQCDYPAQNQFCPE